MTLEELIELVAARIWDTGYRRITGTVLNETSLENQQMYRESAWNAILRNTGLTEEEVGFQIREKVFAAPDNSEPLPKRALRLAKGGLRC